jgi:uncharacterized membrane protein HdeD (DUF308 family)
MENRLNEIVEVRQNWKYFLLLGLLLILLGAGVVTSSFYATIFSIILLGVFLIIGGSIQIAQGFLAHKWSGVFLSLFLGILYIITGFICLSHPAQAALTITLWIAIFCVMAGIFKMLTALIVRFEQWGWVFFNGLVTLLLGVMIYLDWPLSGFWVIGLFIGIDLILTGWSWVWLSLAARPKTNGEIRG